MSALKSSMELVVSYFTRIHIESKYNLDVPIDVKRLIELFAQKHIGCSLLTDNEEFQFYQLLSTKFANLEQIEFKLLYVASDNDWAADFFHESCDNKGPTLTIIENEYGNIFGGYTAVPWSSPPEKGRYKPDKNAFLFTIRQLHNTDEDKQMTIIGFSSESQRRSGFGAVYHKCKYGPIFGTGFDIQISDKCNVACNQEGARSNIVSYVNPSTFDHRELDIFGEADDSVPSGGARCFNIKDYHVFAVHDINSIQL